MGDDTVNVVHSALLEIGFANGIEYGALRPVADVVVNRLRDGGMDDDFIEQIFKEADDDPSRS